MKRLPENGVAIFALIAAGFWLASAYGGLPHMKSYFGAIPPNDAFYLALKFSARMNVLASIFSGLSALCMAIGIFLFWRHFEGGTSLTTGIADESNSTNQNLKFAALGKRGLNDFGRDAPPPPPGVAAPHRVSGRREREASPGQAEGASRRAPGCVGGARRALRVVSSIVG